MEFDMTATAIIFDAGNDKAVLLPPAFHVSAQELWASQDKVTGVIKLRPKLQGDADEQKTHDLGALIKMIAADPSPD